MPNVTFGINVLYRLHPCNNQYCKFDCHTLKQFTLYLFLFDSQTLKLLTSSLNFVALVVSIFAAIVTRPFVKHTTMPWGGRHFCVGACNNGIAQRVWIIIVGHLLLGFVFGCAIQVN